MQAANVLFLQQYVQYIIDYLSCYIKVLVFKLLIIFKIIVDIYIHNVMYYIFVFVENVCNIY